MNFHSYREMYKTSVATFLIRCFPNTIQQMDMLSIRKLWKLTKNI